jgi:RNA polymerase sigma factor (sigma-70 family)
MFGMLAAGDAPRLDSAHLSQVYRLARRLKRRMPQTVDFGDLLSDGFLGLDRAARLFDPSRNVPFEAFAKLYIEGAMVDGLRQRRRQLRATPCTDWAISEFSFDPHIEQSQARRELLTGALRALSRRARLAVLLYYSEGLSMRVVGGCLGITEARVSQLHQRAMIKLRASADAAPERTRQGADGRSDRSGSSRVRSEPASARRRVRTSLRPNQQIKNPAVGERPRGP